MSSITRREFMAGTAALIVGFYLPRRSEAAEKGPFAPNAFIRIGSDNSVTVLVGKAEMGQGVLTSLPMMVAEELEVDLETVRSAEAPADKAYANPMMGMQMTGGSMSVRSTYDQMRQAGATAREMLVAAAASTWGVPPASCKAERGTVVHAATGRKLTYGQLAEKASTLTPPTDVKLKDPKDWKIIGKPMARLDLHDKVTGQATYGLDVKVPGMLIAVVARPPMFGGKVKSFNADKAKVVHGVKHVVQIDEGVAVVADGFWSAKVGRDALQISWDPGKNAHVSCDSIFKMQEAAAQHPGAPARQEGDTEKAFQGASKKLEAVYHVPFLAHATMEPMNCTAHVRADGVDVWAGTQAQTLVQMTASKIAGVPPESVKVHTMFLGCGFGRRFEQDFIAEAVEISKAVKAPVKVVWTREDDMKHDFYRPSTYNKLSAALDASGHPIAWTHRIVGPSIMARAFPQMLKDGIDNTSVEGAANIPYDVPNIYVDYVMQDTGVPVGFWRSVGSSQNAFVTECFLDEVAHAAGVDPLDFRRRLLGKSPRHLAVLETAAKHAGWGSPLPKGRARGLAVHESFGTYVAQVAEVSLKGSDVRVHRVVIAVDSGGVVNPDTVKAQMEGGMVYGLTAALKGEINIQDGGVVEGNFNDYEMLRMNEMPQVEVVLTPSGDPLGGIGEPGTPPIAPAVANAVFVLTGKRVRSLPIKIG